MVDTGAMTQVQSSFSKPSRKQVAARKRQEEEEFAVLKKLASSLDEESSPKQTSHSPCIAFGKYVGEALMAMDERTRLIAMNNIQTAIFQAQMGGLAGNSFPSPQIFSSPMQYGYPCSNSSTISPNSPFTETLKQME